MVTAPKARLSTHRNWLSRTENGGGALVSTGGLSPWDSAGRSGASRGGFGGAGRADGCACRALAGSGGRGGIS
ncbi:hypothetical protein GCM10009816_14800 [Microbacterium aquimaris]